jgi:hypothetical protein
MVLMDGQPKHKQLSPVFFSQGQLSKMWGPLIHMQCIERIRVHAKSGEENLNTIAFISMRVNQQQFMKVDVC